MGSAAAWLAPHILEARVENALWTSFAHDFVGLDVAAGRLAVHVLAHEGTALRSIRRFDGREVNPPFPAPDKCTRIAASHSPGAADVVWVVRESNLRVLALQHGQWRDTPEQGCLDIAAGRADFAAPPQLKEVYGASFDLGELKTLWIDSPAKWASYQGSPTLWMPFTHTYYNMGVAIAAVAAEHCLIASEAPSRVWFLRTDGQIGKASNPGVSLPKLPGGAWDIGAGPGELWAIGTTQAPEPGAKGNALWRFDEAAQRWDWIAGGWGVAIDVDAAGNVWVLDSEGRLHARGARQLAVFEGVRAGPPNPSATKPDECEPPVAADPAWVAYVQELIATLAEDAHLCDSTQPVPTGPGLRPENAIEARAVGAGATIALVAWDDFYADPNCAAKLAARLLSAERGLDVLLCLAPIFTKHQRVPQQVLKLAGLTPDTLDFGNQILRDKYIEHVVALAGVPGARERVRYFSLGNEVNLFLGDENNAGNDALWKGYLKFVETVAPVVRKHFPRARVGVNWTLGGIDIFPEPWRKMQEHCDVLMVNYYADPKATAGPHKLRYEADFEFLRHLSTSFALHKPVVLQEVGMPTSAYLGGNEARQDAFMKFLLNQWDEAGVLLPFVSWFQLWDYLYDDTLKVSLANVSDPENSPINVDQSKYPIVGIGNAVAQAFLGPFLPGEDRPNVWSIDTVHWLNESSTPGTEGRALCEQLSTCGLICKNGRRKKAWYTLRDWAAKRRRLA
jgi:hypothetical protein